MKLTKIKNNNSLKPTTQKQNEPKKKKKKNILIWKFVTHADLKTLLKEFFIKLKEKLSFPPNRIEEISSNPLHHGSNGRHILLMSVRNKSCDF